MSAEHAYASRIYINGVDLGPAGDVRLSYKEEYLVSGEPKARYLRNLLEARGFKVEPGDQIENTPFRSLVVSKENTCLTRDEVVAVLRADDEIDLAVTV